MDGRYTFSPRSVGVHAVASCLFDTYTNFHDVRIKFDCLLKVAHYRLSISISGRSLYIGQQHKTSLQATARNCKPAVHSRVTAATHDEARPPARYYVHVTANMFPREIPPGNCKSPGNFRRFGMTQSRTNSILLLDTAKV